MSTIFVLMEFILIVFSVHAVCKFGATSLHVTHYLVYSNLRMAHAMHGYGVHIYFKRIVKFRTRITFRSLLVYYMLL